MGSVLLNAEVKVGDGGALVIQDELTDAAGTFLFAGFCTQDTDHIFQSEAKLFLATSGDGKRWHSVGSGAVYNPGICREQRIVWWKGRFWCAYSTGDLTTHTGYFAIASSSNLLDWSHVADVTVPDAVMVFAPSFFSDGDTLRIYVSGTPDTLANLRTYVTTCQDDTMTSWSTPASIGYGYQTIDPCMIKVGSTYHLFYGDGNYLNLATSSSPDSGFTRQVSGNAWGFGRAEGPAVVCLRAGLYRMYWDAFDSGGNPSWVKYVETADFSTWSAPANCEFDLRLRNGGIVRLFDVSAELLALGARTSNPSVRKATVTEQMFVGEHTDEVSDLQIPFVVNKAEGSSGQTVGQLGHRRPLYVLHGAPGLGYNLYFKGGQWKFGQGSLSFHYGGLMTFNYLDGTIDYYATTSGGVANSNAIVVKTFTYGRTGNAECMGTFKAGSDMEALTGGFILKSPNGTRWRISVDTSGNLVTTAL